MHISIQESRKWITLEEKKAGGVIIKNEPGQKMNNVDNIKKRYQPLTYFRHGKLKQLDISFTK